MKDGGSLSIIILHGIIIFLFVLYLWSVFAPTKPKNPNPKIPILTSSKSTRKVKKAGGETGIDSCFTFYSSWIMTVILTVTVQRFHRTIEMGTRGRKYIRYLLQSNYSLLTVCGHYSLFGHQKETLIDWTSIIFNEPVPHIRMQPTHHHSPITLPLMPSSSSFMASFSSHYLAFQEMQQVLQAKLPPHIVQ